MFGFVYRKSRIKLGGSMLLFSGKL